MKAQRHLKILELIEKNDIETQDELTNLLNENGFKATQATVSRDIKELRLVKVVAASDMLGKNGADAKYKYAVNSSGDGADSKLGAKFRAILSEATVKSDYAANIVVIHTYAGMAQACAAAIDAMHADTIVGTVAGDDTIMIVMRTESAAEDFSRKIAQDVK